MVNISFRRCTLCGGAGKYRDTDNLGSVVEVCHECGGRGTSSDITIPPIEGLEDALKIAEFPVLSYASNRAVFDKMMEDFTEKYKTTPEKVLAQAARNYMTLFFHTNNGKRKI